MPRTPGHVSTGAECPTIPSMSKGRAIAIILTGLLIAVLALGEMLDQELTVWNGVSLVLGVFLVVYAVMGIRRNP